MKMENVLDILNMGGNNMGIIFGRRGCDEDREYSVNIWFCDNGEPLRVSEQLAKEEADKIYQNIKYKFGDNSKTLEISFGERICFIPKQNITLIMLGKTKN